MFATFLIMLIFPGVGIFLLHCLICGLFGKRDKPQNNLPSYHIDNRAEDEERRINEWGLDDDWRWGKL